MKKITSLILILASVFTLCCCQLNISSTSTMIGEIMHVDYDITNENDLQYHYYYIFVRPYGQVNSHWIKMSVNSNAKTQSAFSVNLEDMPELAVGNVVEIVYNDRFWAGTNVNYCHAIRSIKSIDTVDLETQPASDLIPNNDFSYTSLEYGTIDDDIGTVIHVVKLDRPVGGYLVYMDGTRTHQCNQLICYFIGDIGLLTTAQEVLEKLESQDIGYTIKFDSVEGQTPFKNYHATPIMNITLVEEQ